MKSGKGTGEKVLPSLQCSAIIAVVGNWDSCYAFPFCLFCELLLLLSYNPWPKCKSLRTSLGSWKVNATIVHNRK